LKTLKFLLCGTHVQKKSDRMSYSVVFHYLLYIYI
jgi:hypothetical protein